jgi:hypothetical protein
MSLKSAGPVALLIAALWAWQAHADPREGTCAAACRHLVDCKLEGFKFCMQHCTERDRAKLAEQTRSSCASLAAEIRKGGWICTAEGEGTVDRNGITTPSNIQALGNAPTRDDAAFKALRDCRALLGSNVAIYGTEGDFRTTSGISRQCRVTKCVLPGSQYAETPRNAPQESNSASRKSPRDSKYAQPRNTDGAQTSCAAACRHIAECNVMSYRACEDGCVKSGNEQDPDGRGANAAMARASCEDLAARFHKKPSQ